MSEVPVLSFGQQWLLRRCALLLGILLSGGFLFIPRMPLVVLLIFVCWLVAGFRFPIGRALWPLHVLLFVILLFTLLRPGEIDFESFFIRFANFAAGAFLLQMYIQAPRGSLVVDLQALIWPMTWQAIFTVLLSYLANFLFIPLPFSEIQYYSFLMLFTYHVTIDGFGGFVRPNGFFFEPGVFQIYLNLYLFIALFYLRDVRKSAVGVLAVFSTQSTTGILICLVLICASIVQHFRRANSVRAAFAIVCAVAALPILIATAQENIQEKFFGAYQGSSWSREYDLITGLNIVEAYPLMGIGFDHERYIEVSQRLGHEDIRLGFENLEYRPTTNGLVQLFFSLGVPLGVVFLVGLFRQGFFEHRFLVCFWFLASMMGEAIVFTPFFLLIIFSSFIARGQLFDRSV